MCSQAHFSKNPKTLPFTAVQPQSQPTPPCLILLHHTTSPHLSYPTEQTSHIPSHFSASTFLTKQPKSVFYSSTIANPVKIRTHHHDPTTLLTKTASADLYYPATIAQQYLKPIFSPLPLHQICKLSSQIRRSAIKIFRPNQPRCQTHQYVGRLCRPNCEAGQVGVSSSHGILLVRPGNSWKIAADSVLEAEATGILKATEMASNYPFGSVIIENDSATIMKSLSSGLPVLSHSIKNLVCNIYYFAELSSPSFSFVTRSRNGTADWIAKQELLSTLFGNWGACMPTQLANLICNEAEPSGVG